MFVIGDFRLFLLSVVCVRWQNKIEEELYDEDDEEEVCKRIGVERFLDAYRIEFKLDGVALDISILF